MVVAMHPVFRRGLSVVRWWFGLTYLAGGVGAVIAGPVMIALGNWGGIYMILGGGMLAMTGWALHPWRQAKGRTERRSASPG